MRSRIVCSLALALLVASPAAAASVLIQLLNGASALDGSSDNQFPADLDTGFLPAGPAPFSTTVDRTVTASAGGASGTSYASGTLLLGPAGTPLPGAPLPGVTLRAEVSTAGVGPHGGPNATSGYGIARSLVLYLDELVATGPPGTAVGDPIDFKVTLLLDGAMSLLGSESLNFAQLTFGDPGILSDPIDQLSCRDLNGACVLSDTGTITVLAGIPYGIRLELFATASASAHTLGDALASASGDFTTARLFIDPMSPGTSYTLASGADLRSVPEAGLGALLACATLALAIRLRARSASA
jgi:hypothetical protein